MMRLASALLALLPLALLTSCAADETAANTNSEALADTLSALIESAYDFGSPGTLDRMIALYAEGDEVVSASGGVVTASADSVREGITRFWDLAGQNMRDAEWQWREVHAERLGEDAAVLTGSWAIPHIALDDQRHLIEGAWTAVFRRIGGEWKIVHEHLSSPPEEAVAEHVHP